MSADVEARRRSVIEQAARWYVCCMDEGMTLQECEAMQLWLQASAEHRAELASMFAMSALLKLQAKRSLQ